MIECELGLKTQRQLLNFTSASWSGLLSFSTLLQSTSSLYDPSFFLSLLQHLPWIRQYLTTEARRFRALRALMRKAVRWNFSVWSLGVSIPNCLPTFFPALAACFQLISVSLPENVFQLRLQKSPYCVYFKKNVTDFHQTWLELVSSEDTSSSYFLTLKPLTWNIWWAPNNVSRW